MTEKIIINGVNVAGCMFLCKNTAGHICCGDDIREDKIPFANFCQENKDCYYKQLQGIKQQNLELIQRANAYPKIVILANERLNEIARLEQENKALQAYKDINEDFKKAWDELNEKYKQLRSALEEIKNYCDRIEQGFVIGTQDCLINSIKNITNEVLNND